MVYIPYGDYARSNGHIAESIRRKSPLRSSRQDSTRLKNKIRREEISHLSRKQSTAKFVPTVRKERKNSNGLS